MVTRENAKPQYVVFSLFLEESPRRRLNVTVKILNKNLEAFVETIHFAKKKEVRRKLKTGTLIRGARI